MIEANLAGESHFVAEQPVAPDGGFSAMRIAFASAMAARREEVRTVSMTFGGRPAMFVVAGNALADNVIPAFAHLIENGTRSGRSLPSIELWDSAATGIGRPAAPGEAEWIACGQGWHVSMHGGFRYLCEDRPSSLIYLDRATGQVAALYRDGAQLTLADRARPLQRMMSQICASFGIQDVHAGLVSHAGKGVLIVGGSGRGKTTTAIDCLYGGLDFLGDDSVGISDAADGGFIGHSLYGSARVLPVQLPRWPVFAQAWQLPGPQDDKALLLPSRSFPAMMARTTRIVAIAIPFIGDERSRIDKASPRDAFKALVHDSADSRRFGMKATDFLRLTALTKKTPCYRIGLGSDPERVAADIVSLIDRSAQ